MENSCRLGGIKACNQLHIIIMKGSVTMSYQEIAKNMIDKLPEDKLVFIINILENIGEMSGVQVYPEFTPNEETKMAINEIESMIANGTGEHFEGSTADFFSLMSEN